MQDSTEITYWLSKAGEATADVQITSTITSKVPSIGEIIHLETLIEKDWANFVFTENALKLLPQEDSCVKGEFVVVDVKRFIRRDVYKGNQVLKNAILTDVPLCKNYETFEVVIEPFRHTELTETPIAKLRNVLTPVFGVVEMLMLTQAFPDKEKELLELFRVSLQNEVGPCLERAKELLKNSKNWN